MNLSANINEQATLLLYSILLGVGLGAVYSVLTVIKTLFYSNKVVETILNLIYFPLSAIIFFFFVIGVCGGEWRLYMALGVIFGALVFIQTLGKIITVPLCAIIRRIQKLLLKILRQIKGKIIKIDLKKKAFLLYNKFKYKRRTDYGTESKSKEKQKFHN